MAQAANGFSVIDLYHMPVHLRMFYYNKMVEQRKREEKEMEKVKKQSKVRIKR